MYNFNVTELKKEVGKRVAFMRKSKNLSQEKLADILDIEVRTLSKLENGYTFISSQILNSLCTLWQISPEFFFTFDTNEDVDKVKLDSMISRLKLADKEKLELYYRVMNAIDGNNKSQS